MILVLLADGERPVNALVALLGEAQPAVSKHLRELKSARLVAVRRVGRQRLYRPNPAEIRKVHDWTGRFRSLWEQQFDRLDAYLASKSKRKRDG